MALFKYLFVVCLMVTGPTIFAQEIQWMSWEEAAKANETKPKKIFVDIYTDWCGWCKKMDATTFKDPAVIAIINKDFYPVKLNAEQKESIHWQGQEFKWLPGGRDGYNKLAYDILDGQLSYPTYVLLDHAYSRILISPGYKTAGEILKELKFAAEEHYKTTSWEAYRAKS